MRPKRRLQLRGDVTSGAQSGRPQTFNASGIQFIYNVYNVYTMYTMITIHHIFAFFLGVLLSMPHFLAFFFASLL